MDKLQISEILVNFPSWPFLCWGAKFTRGTMSGQEVKRFSITNITQSNPCVITTQEEHGLRTGDFVRFTDLNGAIPTPRGMDEINAQKYRIVVTTTTEFYIQDPITYIPVNSTNYPAYVTGGSVNFVQNEFIYNGE